MNDYDYDQASTCELKMSGHDINKANRIIDNFGDPRQQWRSLSFLPENELSL